MLVTWAFYAFQLTSQFHESTLLFGGKKACPASIQELDTNICYGILLYLILTGKAKTKIRNFHFLMEEHALNVSAPSGCNTLD